MLSINKETYLGVNRLIIEYQDGNKVYKFDMTCNNTNQSARDGLNFMYVAGKHCQKSNDYVVSMTPDDNLLIIFGTESSSYTFEQILPLYSVNNVFCTKENREILLINS